MASKTTTRSIQVKLIPQVFTSLDIACKISSFSHHRIIIQRILIGYIDPTQWNFKREVIGLRPFSPICTLLTTNVVNREVKKSFKRISQINWQKYSIVGRDSLHWIPAQQNLLILIWTSNQYRKVKTVETYLQKCLGKDSCCESRQSSP